MNRATANIRAAVSELEYLVTVFELMDMPKVKFRLLAIRSMLASVDCDINSPEWKASK